MIRDTDGGNDADWLPLQIDWVDIVLVVIAKRMMGRSVMIFVWLEHKPRLHVIVTVVAW